MGVEKPKKEKCVIPKISAKKKEAIPKDKAEKQKLTLFYNQMLAQAPLNCMESGMPLLDSTFINPRTIIAHILSKSGYPSVSTCPLNIIYLCAFEHSKFDLQTERFMKEAKIASLIRERVLLLLPHLTEGEINKISPYLLK
jgi:hypothetical protein